MNVTREIRKLRWYLRWRAGVRGIAVFLGVTTSAFILALAADPWIGESIIARTFLVLAFWGVVLGTFAGTLVLPQLRIPGPREILDRVERTDPYFQNRVSTAWYLVTHPGEVERLGFSPSLVRRTLRWAENLQPESVFASFYRGGDLIRIAGLAIIPMLLLLLALLFRPQAALEIWGRYSSAPGWNDTNLLPPEVDVAGEALVPRHSPLSVAVMVFGTSRLPWFHLEEKPGFWKGIPVESLGPGLYLARIPSVDRFARYRASVYGILSPVGSVRPVDAPELESVRWRIMPPAYTGLDPTDAETRPGDIEILAGSVVNVAFRADLPLEWMALEAQGSPPRELPIAPDGYTATAVLSPTASLELRLRMAGPLGLSSLCEPIRVEVVSDEAPRVRIAAPEAMARLPVSQQVVIVLEARDDYGLSALDLHYELNYEGNDVTVPIMGTPSAEEPPEGFRLRVTGEPAGKTPGSAVALVEWDLAPLELLPGDEISYWAAARDNDTVAGPKEGRSEVHFLRFPSMYELYESVEKAEQVQLDSLRNVIERQRELRENIEDAAEKLREDVFSPHPRNTPPTWEEQARLEDAAEEQEGIAQELERIAREVQQTSEALQQKAETSLRTLEKMQRVRELFDELLTEEMKDVIRRFQQALEEFRRERGPEPLDDLQFSLEDFEQQLDSLLQLLENTYFERQLEAAVDEMKELLAAQEELLERTREAAGETDRGAEESEQLADRLARQEDEVSDRAGELARRLEELARHMTGLGKEGADSLRQLAREMQEGTLPEQLREAVEQLRGQMFQQAVAPEENARNSLAGAMQSLSQLQSMMGGMSFEQDMAALLAMIHRSQYLSERQEAVESGFEMISRPGVWGNPDRKRDLGQEQGVLALEGRRLRDAFIEFAGESPFRDFSVARLFEDAAAEMTAAAAGTKDQSPLEVRARARAALGHVNLATRKLLESFCSACQAQQNLGLQGYFQRLRDLIGRQKNLNFDTQRLDGMGRQRPSWEEELRRIMREQEGIRRELEQLDELRRQLQNQEQLLGDLDRIGDDISEIEKDLDDRITDDRVQEKQEKVLTRLLDAEKSQREQDLTRERESEVARGGEMPSPPARDHSDELERKTSRPDDRIQPDEVLPRYRSRVRAYFRRLSSELF